MKKFMSVFGVLAITMMGSFAEEVTPQLEEAVVAEEVVNIDDDVPQSQENVAAADIVLHPEGDADFVTFIHQYDDPGNDRSVIANGAHGDTLTYMDETEEMLEIIRDTPDVFVSILLTTYLFKAIVALMDTPFIYAARKIKPKLREVGAEQLFHDIEMPLVRVLADMERYAAVLNNGGTLLLSGFYEHDIPAIRAKAEASGLAFDHYESRQDWVAVKFRTN